MKCFSVNISSSDNLNIWSFIDITSYINKKSMLEVSFIDEDKITDENLKKVVEKNRRLADVVELMESGVFIEGTSGNVVQVNNSFLKMLSGFSSPDDGSDFRAETFHNMLSELCSGDGYFLTKERIISEYSGTTYTDELTFSDGRIFTRIFYPLHIDRQTRGYLWKFKNITQRRKLELYRFEMETMLTALEASENVGLYQEYKGIRFANNGLAHMLRTDRESVISMGIDHFIEKDDTERFGENTVKLKRADGQTRIARMCADTMKVEGMTVRTFSLIDITEKIALSESLKINEEKFRNVFYNNTAPMLMFDPVSFDIIDVNASALRFYGYTPDEMRAKTITDLKNKKGKDKGCRELVEDFISNNSGGVVQVKHMLANGLMRDVELLITPIGHNGDVSMLVIVEDVSERLKYQAELETVNNNLKQIVEQEIDKRRRNEELLMEKMRLAEIGEMIGSIAHQWRQPLNTLGILIQDIMDAKEFGELTDEYLRELVYKGMNQIDYMSRTIDDFRDFFKPTKQAEMFDIKTSVAQVLSIILPQLINHSIECIVYCCCGSCEKAELNTEFLPLCPGHDMKVTGYANEFKQVLLNLISNSKDALADRDIRIIKISLFAEEDHVRVQVEDTGGGIPETLLDRIFDPYFTTKSDKGGTGIGLYMSKAIIEANMKGSLSVENTDDGCRFSVSMQRRCD
ncbi:MAG: ATP-binding protein [Deferribacterales bacterium]